MNPTDSTKISAEEQIDAMCAKLNEYASIDNSAIASLILNSSANCSLELAEYPMIQCKALVTGRFSVGTLGLINGILPGNGEYIIMAEINDDGVILFSRKAVSELK